MDRRSWGRFSARIALVGIVVAAGAGCANEGDLQARWVEAFGTPEGVDRLTTVDCQEPFPGTLEGCAVTVELVDDVDADSVTAIVERYVEVADDVYGEAAGGAAQLGSLILDGASNRTYLFSPRAAGNDEPLRTSPDPAAVEHFVRMRDDDRFREVHVRDHAEPDGSDATIELTSDDPPVLFTRITDHAPEFDELDDATFQARIAGSETRGVAEVSVTSERGRVPVPEWRYALSVVAAEPERGFDVRVSPGRVHLVVVIGAGTDADDRTIDVEAIRARAIAEAPASIDVTVGSRPERR